MILCSGGSHVIWIAPSGGRDRPDPLTGEWHPVRSLPFLVYMIWFLINVVMFTEVALNDCAHFLTNKIIKCHLTRGMRWYHVKTATMLLIFY
jgi:hypothetical protein